jgi:hypothetical protein
MTEQDKKELGRTLWNIADALRGAMNADDFRDYMLSFLFLRYLSDNYEAAARKELGKDYPKLAIDEAESGQDAAGRLVRKAPQGRCHVRETDATQGALCHQARVRVGTHRPSRQNPAR